jgi:hypothetical protein
MTSLALFLECLPTPTGAMLLLCDERQRLRAADWKDHEARLFTLLRRQYGAAATIKEVRRRGWRWRRIFPARSRP